MIILTTAAWTGCIAEFDIHCTEALKAGLGVHVIRGIWGEMGDGGGWGEGGVERIKTIAESEGLGLLAEFVARLLEGKGEVDDGIYMRAVEELGVKKVVEAVGIVGYYSYVAMTLKCFRVKPEVTNLEALGLSVEK